MLIQDHKLVGVPFVPAKVIGAIIDPKFIVHHYTAGYTAESAVHVFKTTPIAAHLIIDRDASVIQMVPFNRRANHAGPSKWAGVSMLNNHSIGIEFVNIGWAKMRADGKLVDAYGKVVSDKDAAGYIEAPNKRVGSGRVFWAPYTQEQITRGIECVEAILDRYTIRDQVSHEEIDTRGWKTDPGPAFPMNRFTALMRGTTAGDPQEDTTPAPAGTTVVVNVDLLNVRSGPGTNFPIIGQTKRGSRLGVVGENSGWTNIHTATGTGWVASSMVSKG